MAGNNAIQILRANSATIANSSETLLDGQLLYNTDKNYLTCGGGGNNTPVNSLPIVCAELVSYYGDDNTISSNVGTDNIRCRVGVNTQVTKLELESKGTLTINACISTNIGRWKFSEVGSIPTINGPGSLQINAGGQTLYLNASTVAIDGSAGAIRMNTHLGPIQINAGPNKILMNAESGINLYAYSGDINVTAMSSGQLNLYGDNGVAIGAYSGVTINQAGNIITFPNKAGTVALRSDIGEVIYSNSGRVIPNTSTSNVANAFSLISSSNIYKYDQILIKFKCSQRPNSSSLSSYFGTSVVADRMGYMDDWGSFSVTPTFITCYYGDFSIFRTHCFIQFSYANGQILANQYQSADGYSYSSYGMTFYDNGSVATFNANNRANFWKIGITDIIGLVKNANYLNS